MTSAVREALADALLRAETAEAERDKLRGDVQFQYERRKGAEADARGLRVELGAEHNALLMAIEQREAAEAELAKVREGRDADRRILEGFRQAAEAERDNWKASCARYLAARQTADAERDRLRELLHEAVGWMENITPKPAEPFLTECRAALAGDDA